MSKQAFPPGPTSAFPAGLLFRLRRDPLGFFSEVTREFGPIAHWRVGPQRVFLVNHPEGVETVLVKQYRHFVKSGALTRSKVVLGQGLLTSEGDHHLRQRRMIQPAFHRKRIGAYAETMAAYAARTSASWRDGETRDMATEMMRLTLAIVGATLFGAEVEEDAEAVQAAVDDLYGFFDTIMMPFASVWQRVPTAKNRRAWAALAQLDAIVYRLISARRSALTDAGDLLSMLLAAQDAEGDGQGMSDAQVRDEAMTLFLAGHETTANALAWAWYVIATHPEVREKLENELDAVLGGRPPTLDDLPQLVYTERVFAESLRLYPSGWGIVRKATADTEVMGYTVPKGAVVVMSPYLMQRQEAYWPDPERFDPDRWTPEAKAERPKFAYFPFSGGPRSCIGEPFAWMEAVIILATLAQAWRMRLAPGQVVEKEPLVTLRPKFGMRMVLERRGAHDNARAHGPGAADAGG